MPKNNNKNRNGKIIEVHNDLIAVLERVKEKIAKVTYSALTNISWIAATRCLAKIIEEEKIKI